MQLTVKSSLVIGGVSLIGLIGTARAESSWAEAVPRSPPPLVPPSTPPGAGAPEPPPPATHVFPLNVRVGTDFAGYADSDHVFVVTPSLAGHVENPTAGWSVDGSYRVDVVSAASVDIVSTASRNYTEVRQAGTLAADYRPNTWGGAVNGSVSSEPDYLSWSAGRKRDEGRARKERDAPFGLQSHLRHRRPYGDPLLGLLAEAGRRGPERGAHARARAGHDWVVRGRRGLRGRQSVEACRYVPLFAPGTTVPNVASVALVTSLRVAARPLEQLPLSRQRYAGSLRVAHRFAKAKSTLRLDERLYDDSWALKASSTDSATTATSATRRRSAWRGRCSRSRST